MLGEIQYELEDLAGRIQAVWVGAVPFSQREKELEVLMDRADHLIFLAEQYDG